MPKSDKPPLAPAVYWFLFACLPLAASAATATVRSIRFDLNVGDRLHRAAIASTPEIALTELDAALVEARRLELTAGSTAVFIHRPDRDVGYWFANLEAAAAELRQLPASASAQEKTNVLMKLRETLVSSRGGRPTLNCPAYISLHPNVLGLFAAVAAGVLPAMAAAWRLGRVCRARSDDIGNLF